MQTATPLPDSQSGNTSGVIPWAALSTTAQILPQTDSTLQEQHLHVPWAASFPSETSTTVEQQQQQPQQQQQSPWAASINSETTVTPEPIKQQQQQQLQQSPGDALDTVTNVKLQQQIQQQQLPHPTSTPSSENTMHLTEVQQQETHSKQEALAMNSSSGQDVRRIREKMSLFCSCWESIPRL